MWNEIKRKFKIFKILNVMIKKDIIHEQFNLFGTSINITEPKKKRNILTEKEKILNIEKNEAHIAWKLLKSRKFGANITDRQKFLLQKYYGIRL